MAKFAHHDLPLDVDGARVGIVAARFNAPIVDVLLEGALAALAEHGVAEPRVIRVPGAFELPVCAKMLAQSSPTPVAPLQPPHPYNAVIALGAVIRGDTPHFEYVSSACAHGLMEVSVACTVPVIFGVLTVDTMEQARARAGGREGNKGVEAAVAALEMITVQRKLHPQPSRNPQG